MRNAIIVDASVVLKWVIDEDNSDKATALLSRWFIEGTVILAPVLLIYELTNAIYQHVRRGELFLDDVRQTLGNALLTFLELDSPVDSSLSRRAMELAQQYRLPATYDAHYLALAEREQCEYWTADTRLWSAVKGKLAWVRWLSDYQPDVP
jgi:predicted nucleic acid-binding protein